MRQLTLFSFCAPKGQKDVPAARPSASTCTDMGDADDDTSVVTALLEGANAACSTYETITVEGASDTCSTSASITAAVGKVDNHVSDSSLSQDPHESPIRMSPSSKRLQASRTCASEPPSANTCKRSKTLASTSAPRLKMCPTPPTAPSLCEYEKQRLENIRRSVPFAYQIRSTAARHVGDVQPLSAEIKKCSTRCRFPTSAKLLRGHPIRTREHRLRQHNTASD